MKESDAGGRQRSVSQDETVFINKNACLLDVQTSEVDAARTLGYKPVFQRLSCV